MKRYKKKIVALTLASLVTVAGSFADSNYKNSLTGLRFSNTQNGEIRLTVQTRSPYAGTISPIRKDANTYILTLPEVKSEADIPNLQNVYGSIESVNIRTMPYSNSAKGYTRITIKTNQQSLKLLTTNQVFIPQEKNTKKNTIKTSSNSRYSSDNNLNSSQNRLNDDLIEELSNSDEPLETTNEQEPSTPEYKPLEVEKVAPVATIPEEKEKSSDHVHLLLLSILIFIGCAFFYIRANNKMKEIVGFLDNDEDKDVLPQNITSKIKNTVNKIDKAYPQGTNISKIKKYQNIPTKTTKKADIESLNIIDLDTLFKEQRSKEIQQQSKNVEIDEENSALEDFLSGFSFDEDFGNNATDIEEISIYDEELYEKVLNKENIVFSKEDISCINKLLNNEVLDSTMNNIENYAVSNPISKGFSKQKFVEEMVLTYAVNQGILFKANDVEILNKLMSVELDNDFITDLRTNSRKTIEMETAILLNENELKKPSEVKTLDVKENLPDLSEALKKLGNKKIVSEYKPQTEDFNTNCEVKTLSVGKEVQDLVLDLYKDDLFKYKPSASYEFVDSNYSIGNNAIKFNTSKGNKAHQKKNITQKSTSNESTLKENIKQPQKEMQQERIAQIKNNIVEKPKTNIINCFLDGESMKILSSIELGEEKGCYLAKKSDGYLVLGYIKDTLIKIKSYSELKSEKIQARKSEDLPDGTSRYIVRIGINKFIIDLKENEIKYVMDLC